MIAIAQVHPLTARVDAGALRRGQLAGSGWGLSLAIAFTAMGAWQCGGICIEEALTTTAISLVAGILTIGPLVALGGHPKSP